MRDRRGAQASARVAAAAGWTNSRLNGPSFKHRELATTFESYTSRHTQIFTRDRAVQIANFIEEHLLEHRLGAGRHIHVKLGDLQSPAYVADAQVVR